MRINNYPTALGSCHITTVSARRSFPHMDSISSGNKKSAAVFSAALLLALIPVSFPEMPPAQLHGIPWGGMGLLMLVFPPVIRIPRFWLLLAAGFVAASLIGFLPREWFHLSGWRLGLEKAGLDTGSRIFLQAPLAAETLAGLASTALTAVFLLGHRAGDRWHYRLLLLFASLAGVWAAVAVFRHEPEKVFGFFPNRNHSATFLVMGSLAGGGALARAIRLRSVAGIVLGSLAAACCLYALLVVSESRAGLLLLVTGTAVWLALTGWRHLPSHAMKAVVLSALAAGGLFLVTDNPLKKRIETTLSEPRIPESSASPVHPEESEHTPAPWPLSRDGRISIYKATWSMFRSEPWTGIGPGQFRYVFPQYSGTTISPNDSIHLHPESDWLMTLVEHGWPATLFLLTGIASVTVAAARRIRQGRSIPARAACLAAALIVPLHGLFDVPGHRPGLAMVALLLAALSLRPHSLPNEAPPRRWPWMITGILLVCGAGWLLSGGRGEKSPLVRDQLHHLRMEIHTLYEADRQTYEEAIREGRDHSPPPDDDPLEKALELTTRASSLLPLDPHLHYLEGVLALHFDNKLKEATRAFAIQRLLLPERVRVPLEQGLAWAESDPTQTTTLWRDAMERASRAEKANPDSNWRPDHTYSRILDMASNPILQQGPAASIANGNPALCLAWAKRMPPAILDQSMPDLIRSLSGASERTMLLEIWKNRGSAEAAYIFSLNNASLFAKP